MISVTYCPQCGPTNILYQFFVGLSIADGPCFKIIYFPRMNVLKNAKKEHYLPYCSSYIYRQNPTNVI